MENGIIIVIGPARKTSPGTNLKGFYARLPLTYSFNNEICHHHSSQVLLFPEAARCAIQMLICALALFQVRIRPHEEHSRVGTPIVVQRGGRVRGRPSLPFRPAVRRRACCCPPLESDRRSDFATGKLTECITHGRSVSEIPIGAPASLDRREQGPAPPALAPAFSSDGECQIKKLSTKSKTRSWAPPARARAHAHLRRWCMP